MGWGMFDALEDQLLSHIFEETTLGAYSTAYIGLCTTDCSEAGIGTEVSGGGYARVSVGGDWTVTDGVATNTNTIRFPEATAPWGNVQSWFITRDATGQTGRSWYATLGTPGPVNTGRIFEIPAGELSIHTYEIGGGSNHRASSSYTDASILNHVLNNVTWAKPPGTYVALSTTNPTRDGSGITEPSVANNYTRQQVLQVTGWNSSLAGTGLVKNAAPIEWLPAEPSGWGTINWYGIFDAASGGNMLWWSWLNSSVVVGIGDAPYFAVDAFSMALT